MATITTTTTAPPVVGTARWTRLASLGLAMTATAPILMILASVLWGLDDAGYGFFGAVAVALIGAMLLIRRRHTALRALGILLGVLGAVTIFWTAFGLAAPASFFDFVPGLLAIPGALIALIAGIASIRAGRRGDMVEGAGNGERRAMQVILGMVGLLVVMSAVLSFTSRKTVSSSEAAKADVVVHLSSFEFDKDSYEITGGETVLVKNDDPFQHTFTIDALEIDVTLTPGSEKLVTIPAQPGDYVVYCDPHTSNKEDPDPDHDMTSRITVD